MTDVKESALLAEILAHPADDLRRLVYADFLDERRGPGDAERAELIRSQVEQVKMSVRITEKSGRFYLEPSGEENHQRYVGIMRRDRELLDAHGREWAGHKFAMLNHGIFECGRYSEAFFSRGFVSHICCTLAEWCGVECRLCCGHVSPPNAFYSGCPSCHGTGGSAGIGPQVVREHPVERVALTDIAPVLLPWSLASTGRAPVYGLPPLPRPISRLVPDLFDSPESAINALSDALIRWAKSQSAALVSSQ